MAERTHWWIEGGWVFLLSVSLSLCVSLSPSIYRATFLAIYLSTCLFMYLSIDLFIHLSIKMSIFLSSHSFKSVTPAIVLKMLQNHHVLVTFQWMHNPLRLPHKTTSERPKCLRDPQFLTLLTSKCASRHSAVHFFDISTSKSAPRPPVFNTFTSKCASRHNAVHFFDISTSKSAPRPTSLNTFYFPMCLSMHLFIRQVLSPLVLRSTSWTCRSICLAATSTTKQCC